MQDVAPNCPPGQGKSKSAKARRKLAELLSAPVHESQKSEKRQPRPYESHKTCSASPPRGDHADQWTIGGASEVPGGIIGRAVWLAVSFALVLLGARWGSEVGTNRRLKELNAELEHLRAQQDVAHCISAWQGEELEAEVSPPTRRERLWEPLHGQAREANKSMHTDTNEDDSTYSDVEEAQSACGELLLLGGAQATADNSQCTFIDESDSTCNEIPQSVWARTPGNLEHSGRVEACREPLPSASAKGANHSAHKGIDKADGTCTQSPILGLAREASNPGYTGKSMTDYMCSESPSLDWAQEANDQEDIGIEEADAACCELQPLVQLKDFGKGEADSSNESTSLVLDTGEEWTQAGFKEERIAVEMPRSWRLQWSNSSDMEIAETAQSQVMGTTHSEICTSQTECPDWHFPVATVEKGVNHKQGAHFQQTSWQLSWANSSSVFSLGGVGQDNIRQIASSHQTDWQPSCASKSADFTADDVEESGSMQAAHTAQIDWRARSSGVLTLGGVRITEGRDLTNLQHTNWQLSWANSSAVITLGGVREGNGSWQVSWANTSAVFTLGGGREANARKIAYSEQSDWQFSWPSNSAVFALGSVGEANGSQGAHLQQTGWQLSWANRSAVLTYEGRRNQHERQGAELQHSDWQLSWANTSALIRHGGGRANGSKASDGEQTDDSWHISSSSSESAHQRALGMIDASVKRAQVVNAQSEQSGWQLVWTRLS